jgi:hypothetical protein
VLGALAMLAAGPAAAFDESDDGERLEPLELGAGVHFKLTPTWLHTTNEPDAGDLNLRANLGPHTAWVGYYRQSDVFRQTRAGYERAFDLPFGRLVAGVQAASRGFFGGAVGAEIGTGPVFGLLGFGRTNLRPYYNLNFDPNDAITFGAGWRPREETTIALYQVYDDRLGTGQRVTHLAARTRPTRRTRWGVDLFHRSGLTAAEDGVRVSGTGVAVTVDYERWFARVAWDPKVNFTPEDMLRVAVGARF